jgi:hypothetical protein
MATQEETKQAIEDSLKRIGQESRVIFKDFAIETYTGGGYGSGTWTYQLTQQKVALVYWFSSFSSRKEEADITYQSDDNKEKLENDLRGAFTKVRQFVNRKKGIF